MLIFLSVFQRAISDEETVGLGLVLAPSIVLMDIVCEIASEERSVERKDGLDVELGSLLKQRLHLSAIFAHDIEIIATGLAIPVIESLVVVAEFTESVGCEKHFSALVVGDHHLGPVHHGGQRELKDVAAHCKSVALLHCLHASVKVDIEELRYHTGTLRGTHHFALRETLHDILDIGGMVGLEVLHDKIVGLASVEHLVEFLYPLLSLALVDGVEDSDLCVINHV